MLTVDSVAPHARFGASCMHVDFCQGARACLSPLHSGLQGCAAIAADVRVASGAQSLAK